MRFSRALRTRPVMVCPGIRFTTFGIAWSQAGSGSIAATVQTGPTSRRLGTPTVAQAEDAGPDLGTPDARHQTGRATDPVWVGDAKCARFSLTVPAGVDFSDVHLAFLNTVGTAFGGRAVYGLAAAPVGPAPAPLAGFIGASTAEAWAYRPRIITRAQWGADEGLRNCGPYYSVAVKMAFVHHTDNPNNYSPNQSAAIVRGIYWYHTQVLHWCDIAYNFLVDRYGQVFEGRYGGMTLPVLPGATRGFNTNSTAVAAIGNFQIGRPPSAMLNALNH
ncbi:MAG TPA: N-acetylmuramoyl-L-alanine amidase, partial [Actinomycetota bacterium]|nr:N-acetylmuramoyl-L-alanine amidase [Actinomycetota bacterium]